MFDRHGNLPVGMHDHDETKLREEFVDPFPRSLMRRRIFEGFARYRQALEAFKIALTQWIDGSFVTSKIEPNDIDLTNFADYDTVNEFARKRPDDKEQFTILVNGRDTTKSAYHVHSFFVPACAKDHPYFPVYDKLRNYWSKWWSTDRLGRRKGIVRMTVGSVENAPVVPAN